MSEERLNLLNEIVAKAKRRGADEAEAMQIEQTSVSLSWREGKTESLEQANTGDIGIRVFIGKQQASVSTTDTRPDTVDALIERAIAMARVAPEDPFAGLASQEEVAKTFPSLESADAFDFAPEVLIERARAAEDAALAVPGITLVDSTNASASETHVAIVMSNGFSGAYRRTAYGLSASVLAGADQNMVTDYDYAARVFESDLPDAASIGKQAGERTVRALNARKMPTCQVPVIFDPREASGLLGTFAGCISGSSVARGTTFLKDSLGQKVFADAITILDDPHRPRGHRSRLFDGEGLLPMRRAIVENGILQTWFLDLRSARQLGLKSTGHAARSVGGVPSPSPSNLSILPGALSPQELMRDVKQGFYVTHQMGMGINGVTGDYSQAARGFWIENGEIAFPVDEVTIAGNMRTMFQNLTAANDLKLERGIDTPTLRIDGMTLAGS